MPIENPIDKLYSDMTGLPFPVSAAVTGGDKELAFGTLNIEMLDPAYNEFSAITMTANQDMTDKEVYVNGGGDDNMYFTIRMIPSDSDSKLLVIDPDYENTYGTGMFVYPNDIATTLIQPDDAAGPSTNYHIDYNWGTAVIDYLEHGRDGESDPEFRITLDADLSDWAMAQIAEGEAQGGVFEPYADPEVHLDANYTAIYFEQGDDPATMVGNHFHGVAYASVSENIQTLCENWDSMNPTDLYCMNMNDVVADDPGGMPYPMMQVSTGFRATFGTYTPDCTQGNL